MSPHVMGLYGASGWPSVTEQILTAHRLRAARGADEPRLEAILFAPRGEVVTEQQVIPRLPQLHYESGDVIDVYIPGYYSTPVPTDDPEIIVGGMRYVWRADVFVEMSKLASRAFPGWHPKGDCDLLLVLSRALPQDGTAVDPNDLAQVFDPATAYQIWLTRAVQDEAIPSIHEFLVGLIEYAEQHQDPRGFMLQSVGQAGLKAFFEWVLSALPGQAQPLWKKTRYLAPAFAAQT